MSAMAAFTFDDGIAISSVNETLALRIRVSMSATGSVMVIVVCSPRGLPGRARHFRAAFLGLDVDGGAGSELPGAASVAPAYPATRRPCGCPAGRRRGRAPGSRCFRELAH